MNIKEVHEYVRKNMSHLLTKLMTSVLVVVCFRGRFGIKFQKSWGWFIPKTARNKHMFLVNQTKPTNTFYWNWYLLTVCNDKSVVGNCKTARNYKIILLTVQCLLQWTLGLMFVIFDSYPKGHFNST